jgi:multicomponent Na+:H+ antiporter subunit F
MLNFVMPLTLALLALAAIFSLVRVLRGPTVPDRVISLDLIGVLIVGLTVVTAAATGEHAFLDVAMVIALVSFVGTVAYARYVEREGRS